MKEMMRSRIYIFTAADLVGICCQEITNVSVKKGSSISIPCLYDSRYTDNEKYLCPCKKYVPVLGFCQKVIETGQSSKSTKYSIFDDKLQHVFSVTIRDLTDADNCFLCRVSRRFPFIDPKHKISLQLSDVSSLHVDRQSITAVSGGSVTILCLYAKKNNFKWCKLGSKCILKSGKMNGLKVNITKHANGSEVTMNGLMHKHSGWYFCQNDGFQMPVNLTVSEEVATTAYVTNVTYLSTPEPSTTFCPNATTATQPVNFSTTAEKEVDLQPNTVIVIASLTTLVLLTFVIAAVASWKMAKCRKSLPTEPHTAQVPQTVQDQDVLYSDIIHTPQASNNNKDEVREATVIYATILKQDTALQTSGPPPKGSVIYSTVSK